MSIARRINAERLMLLGWSRAILLQLAHPLVAAGIDAHSTFRGGRLAAASRLHQTVRAMLALTFGDVAQHAAALESIRAIHRRVHGQLPAAIGPFPAGTAYSAEDPELVLWVHATLLDSIPLTYERVIAPLGADDRDVYCAEAASVAVDLGARECEVPRRWLELTTYIEAMYASGRLAVSDEARALADAVLAPPLATLVAPAAWVNRLFTIGTLPAGIRSQYGFRWEASDERRLARVCRGLRLARRATPGRLATWPEARTTVG